MELLFLLLFLGLALSQLSVSSDDNKHIKPDCLETCLLSYYHDYPDQSAGCARSSNQCVCSDPVLAPIVGCCLAANCTSTDARIGTDWLVWACDTEDRPIESPFSCIDVTKTTSSETTSSPTSTTVSSTSTSETSQTTTSTSSESSTTTTTETPSITSTTTVQPDPTSTAEPTSSAPPASPITPSSPEPAYALPLGIGLGIGIPLTTSAFGLIFFLFWRSKRDSRAQHHQRRENTRRRRGLCGCGRRADSRASSPVISDVPYYVAPPQPQGVWPPSEADKGTAVEMQGRGVAELPSWVGR